jgi:hypothetical protein
MEVDSRTELQFRSLKYHICSSPVQGDLTNEGILRLDTSTLAVSKFAGKTRGYADGIGTLSSFSRVWASGSMHLEQSQSWCVCGQNCSCTYSVRLIVVPLVQSDAGNKVIRKIAILPPFASPTMSQAATRSQTLSVGASPSQSTSATFTRTQSSSGTSTPSTTPLSSSPSPEPPQVSAAAASQRDIIIIVVAVFSSCLVLSVITIFLICFLCLSGRRKASHACGAYVLRI